MLHLALTLQVVQLLYNQVFTLCDFFPFNGVRFNSRRERIAEAIGNFVPMALPLAGFLLRSPTAMEFGVVCNFILLGGEFATWWLPYFFGPSPKWLEIYSRVHRPTLTVLPRRGTNPVANLEHLILMAITLSTSIATMAVYRAEYGGTFPHLWIDLIIAVVIVGGIAHQTTLAGRNRASVPPPAPADP